MSPYSIPGLKREHFERPYLMSEVKQLKYAIEIIEQVSQFYEIPLKMVYSKDRHRDFIKVCQVSSWIIFHKMPKITLRKVAELYGVRYFGRIGFDHSAILYNRKTIQGMIDVKDEIFYDVDALLKII